MPFEPLSKSSFVPSDPVPTYREETGQVITAPSGLSGPAVGYLDDTQNSAVKDDDFFGFTNITDAALNFEFPNPLKITKANVGAVASFFNETRATGKVREAELLEQELIAPTEGLTTPQGLRTRTAVARLGVRAAGRDMLSSESVRLREEAAKISEKHNSFMDKHDLRGEGILYDISTLPSTIGLSVASLVAFKSAVPAAIAFGRVQQMSIYQEARAAGKEVASADVLSAISGAVESSLEFVGGEVLLGALRNSKKMGVILFGAIEEAFQEVLQQTGEEVLTQTSGIREVDIPQGAKNIAYAGVLGAIGGGGAVSVVVALKGAAQDEGVDITDEQASDMAEAIEGVLPQLEDALADEMSDQGSDMKGTEQESAAAEKIVADFIQGKDIDTSNLSAQDQELLKSSVEGQAVKIEKEAGLREIEVEEDVLQKRVVILENEASKIKTELNKAEAPALVSSLNAKLTKINTELDDLIVEQEDVGNRKLVATAGQVLNKQKETTRKVRSAFKTGVRLAKADIEAAQSSIIEFLDSSRLVAEDKAKFIKTIKNIQTIDQLRKASPEIQRRVERLLNAEAVRKQKATLKKLLAKKAIKAKVQAKKKIGKFDAQTQERLEELGQLQTLTQEQAQDELDKRLVEDAPDALANRILNIKADPDNVDASFVAVTIAEVKAIKELGLAKAEARKAGTKAAAKDVRDVLDAHLDKIDPEALTRKQTGAKASIRKGKQAVRSGISILSGSWAEIIDRVAPESLEGSLGVRKEISKQKQIVRVMGEKYIDAAHIAYDIEKPGALLKELRNGDKVEDLGTFINMRGEEVRLEASRAQARKVWMEAQNERLREQTLQSEDGNAYTDEMMAAMFSIMTKEESGNDDYAFAQAQLDVYEEFYDQINEVYSRVFGVNLPKEDFYSPIAREADLQDTNEDIFLREISFRRALASGTAIKLRDKNAVAPLVVRSDIDVFNSHIAEMSRFIAFREKTQLLDGVFGKADLRRKIKLTFGEPFNKEITENLEAIAGTGKATQTVIDKSINYLNRNFATAQLGAKAKIGLTQLSSYPSYAEFIPTVELVKGTGDFFLNHKKAIKILGGTELMQARGASVDLEIARMGKAFDNAFVQRVKEEKANLIDYLLIFTKFGDRAAIYSGGWAVYKHNINQGKTHEEAIAEFERATSLTQQSKDIDQLAYLQRANAITRGLTMFMSAPIAQFRGEIRAIRKFQKGEATKEQLAKGLIIYHVLIPQIYQALANGILFGEIDDEDQLRAFLLGSLNGVPIMGEVINAGFRKIQGKASRPQDTFKWMATMKEALVSAYDGLLSGATGDFEEAITAMVDLSNDAAELSGFPAEQLERIVEGGQDITEGEIKTGVQKIAGFPKSVTGRDKKKRSFNP